MANLSYQAQNKNQRISLSNSICSAKQNKKGEGGEGKKRSDGKRDEDEEEETM